MVNRAMIAASRPPYQPVLPGFSNPSPTIATSETMLKKYICD